MDQSHASHLLGPTVRRVGLKATGCFALLGNTAQGRPPCPKTAQRKKGSTAQKEVVTLSASSAQPDRCASAGTTGLRRAMQSQGNTARKGALTSKTVLLASTARAGLQNPQTAWPPLGPTAPPRAESRSVKSARRASSVLVALPTKLLARLSPGAGARPEAPSRRVLIAPSATSARAAALPRRHALPLPAVSAALARRQPRARCALLGIGARVLTRTKRNAPRLRGRTVTLGPRMLTGRCVLQRIGARVRRATRKRATTTQGGTVRREAANRQAMRAHPVAFASEGRRTRRTARAHRAGSARLAHTLRTDCYATPDFTALAGQPGRSHALRRWASTVGEVHQTRQGTLNVRLGHTVLVSTIYRSRAGVNPGDFVELHRQKSREMNAHRGGIVRAGRKISSLAQQLRVGYAVLGRQLQKGCRVRSGTTARGRVRMK
mmetsp:Transcript_73050/g.152553  ORF Transcript_73050/g.152553 Transcript_73050/m.152553 type:complete len:435 (-) Transcript_73050:3389-4693(-)